MTYFHLDVIFTVFKSGNITDSKYATQFGFNQFNQK